MNAADSGRPDPGVAHRAAVTVYRARCIVASGAFLSALGLFFSAAASHTLGTPLTLVGWAALLYGIHVLGRSGRPKRLELAVKDDNPGGNSGVAAE